MPLCPVLHAAWSDVLSPSLLPPSQVRSSEDARPYGVLRLTVRREHVFEDSFHQLRSRTPQEMKFKLTVQFQVGR